MAERRPSSPTWSRRVATYCLRHPVVLSVSFGSAALGSLIAVTVPFVVRHVVDAVLAAGNSGADAGRWTVVLICLALVQYIVGCLSRYSAGRLSLDVAHDMRTDTFAALLRLDGRGQDGMRTGQVISRTVSDMSLVQGLLVTVPAFAGTALLFLLSLVVMAVLSPVLAALAVVTGLALWGVAEHSRRRLLPANRAAQQRLGEVVGRVEAAVAGVRVVKGFGQEEREVSELRNEARLLFGRRMRVVRLQSRYSPALQAIPVLGQVGVLLLGGWLALRDELTLGTFLAFSVYMAQLVGPARRLTSQLIMVQQARTGVERVLDITDTSPGVVDPARPSTLPPGPLGLEFDGVRFGYDGPLVLRELSFSAAAGETLAVVGTAGSGKSTIAALLSRFYDVDAGRIRLGGLDLRDVALTELHSRIGVAFEDSFLFSGTIRENIAFAAPDSDEECIRAAARAAQADAFIQVLPNGYDTVVGERGLNLSGGQRQRIALARALLPDPSVLVLDDATSAVDPHTEAAIHATLRRITADRTTILFARRRSSLDLADRIIVLDQGRVADIGTFDALVTRSPMARSLLQAPEGNYGAGGPTQRAVIQVDGQGPTAGRPGAAMAAPAGPTAPRASEPTESTLSAADSPDIPDAVACAPAPDFSLAQLLRPVRLPLLLGLLFLCLDMAAQLSVPALVSAGIDHGVVGGSLGALALMSALALGVIGLGWMCSRRSLFTTGRTGERLLYLLRVRSFAHLQRLSLEYYERERGGRIMTRMTTDVDAFGAFLQTGLSQALLSLITLVGVLAALTALDPVMSLVLVATLPLILATTYLFRRYAMPAYADAREKIGVLNTLLYENAAGLRVTQACGRTAEQRHGYHAASRAYRDARLRAHVYISLYFQFVQLLTELARAVVLLIGGARLASGDISAGVLIAFFLYLDLFFAPLQQLSQVFDGYRQASVGLSRVRELMRTPTATPETADAQPVGRLAGEVRLCGVRFSYPGAGTKPGNEAVAGMDLLIRRGETVALVGRSGAGKSSVLKLIARFYDPSVGAVLVDGRDIRSLDLRDYRRRIGLVVQEPYLSPGTVRHVIAYGRPEATDADVEKAARAVGAHEMITGLSGGYLHPIAEQGRNLSAGQSQLLALARAELVDPDILLLDEATALLDPATEVRVAAASARLARHRTTVIVAHRLTTAARADRIVVLEHGRIVETGQHHDLLAAHGSYAELWSAYTTPKGTSAGAAATRRGGS
ncbi:ABC transporter ATP-binding protein [Streptomyces sp. NPDC059970]|uniref:ABC transporter ATP-binding protein n=1 Tax=Streptomyces sp. NPDC059970 TaxID=3347019 RepID=UPI0036ABB0F5